jgi:hypothetical protein
MREGNSQLKAIIVTYLKTRSVPKEMTFVRILISKKNARMIANNPEKIVPNIGICVLFVT